MSTVFGRGGVVMRGVLVLAMHTEIERVVLGMGKRLRMAQGHELMQQTVSLKAIPKGRLKRGESWRGGVNSLQRL